MARAPNPALSIRRLVDNVLQVGDIVAGPALSFDPSETCGHVRSAMTSQGFDVGGIGTPLNRYVVIDELVEADPEEPVATVARPVLAEDCVEPSLALAEFIGLMASRSFVFVLRGREIGGIATRSDLQAPGITVAVLAHLVSIELALSTLIPRVLGDGWPTHLPQSRLDKAVEMLRGKRRENVDTGLEDCLYFSDWLTLAEHPQIREVLEIPSAKALNRMVGAFGTMRNELAHGGTIIDGCSAEKAVERFGRIRDFLDRAWSAVDRTDDIWQTYLDTEITIDGVRLDEAPAILDQHSPVFVLTGWNPNSALRSREVNVQANVLLSDVLQEHGVVVHEALGRSPSGDWAEESLAFGGLDRGATLKIAREFGQKAFFEISEGHVHVVRCLDGVVTASRRVS